MNSDSSTNPVEIENKDATDYIEESFEDEKTVSATNDPPKAKPKRINRSQLEKRPKIGRNSPCPCGSGIKYKKCHLLKQQQELQKQIEMRRQVNEFTEKVSESKGQEKEVSQESD